MSLDFAVGEASAKVKAIFVGGGPHDSHPEVEETSEAGPSLSHLIQGPRDS